MGNRGRLRDLQTLITSASSYSLGHWRQIICLAVSFTPCQGFDTSRANDSVSATFRHDVVLSDPAKLLFARIGAIDCSSIRLLFAGQ